MGIVFNEFLDRFLSFFGSLGSGFSNFLGLENRLGKEGIFSGITDLETLIWRRRST